MSNRESPIPPAIPPSVPPSVSLHKNKLKSPESIGCICYDYQVLRAITHNFDDTKYSLGGYLLGEGGFGPVYLGFLCSTSVAIKVLQNPSVCIYIYTYIFVHMNTVNTNSQIIREIFQAATMATQSVLLRLIRTREKILTFLVLTKSTVYVIICIKYYFASTQWNSAMSA